jgi:ribulose-phosphate 3-epimerase
MNVYPALLTGSKYEAQQQAMWISSYPKIRTLHIDVIDGRFIDNVTITPVDFPDIDFGELSIDLHLMTEEPLDFVYETIEHQEFYTIRSMIAQVERMSSQAHFLEAVKKNNWQAGLSLDLFTPFEAIDEDSWHELDSIQLMGVEAGFQGQSFQKQTIEKIKDLVVLRQQLDRSFEIIVDGGITPELVADIEDAGADSIVVGSALWSSENQDQLDETMQLLDS